MGGGTVARSATHDRAIAPDLHPTVGSEEDGP